MATSLHPCPTCQRHVRATETTCPLCRSPLPTGFAPAHETKVVPHHELTRALMAVGFASSVACGTTTASAYGFAQGWDADISVVDGSEQDAGVREAATSREASALPRADAAKTGDATGAGDAAHDASEGGEADADGSNDGAAGDGAGEP
jgi:hypothetical protein